MPLTDSAGAAITSCQVLNFERNASMTIYSPAANTSTLPTVPMIMINGVMMITMRENPW